MKVPSKETFQLDFQGTMPNDLEQFKWALVTEKQAFKDLFLESCINFQLRCRSFHELLVQDHGILKTEGCIFKIWPDNDISVDRMLRI